MNLCVNARDAMPGGGRLTIETANVELDEQYAHDHISVVPGAYVMLAISDTGTGMDEETRAHIFEPFFTTKEEGKGTGLGLSTVFGIIKQSGGYVWAYSEVGHGTTFKVYFPRELSSTDAAARSNGKPRRVDGTETILVVEDAPAVRNAAARILSASGYTVLPAASGGEAILVCEAHEGPIHLLLTDVVMPKMSGSDLAKRIVAMRPALKVAYMSGYTDDAITHHGVLDPGVRLINKPFSAADLTAEVRQALDTPPIRD